MSDSLYPIAVLVEELKSPDVARRTNSMKHLSTIAIGLGYERTRSELIPYLADLMDDEEEVLLAMACALKDFVSLVGGKTHIHILLEPLEQLCQVEDTSVRAAAVHSLASIVNSTDDRLLDEDVLDLLQRLVEAEWFTSRLSAAQLLPAAVLKLAPGGVDQALSVFAMLVRDQHPQVRRAAAEVLKGLGGLKSQQAKLMGFAAELLADNEDCVRLLVVDCLIEFAKGLSPAQLSSQVLPMLRTLVSDQSWRVRYKLADRIAALGTAVGPEIVKISLQTAYTCLLQDSEAEVRTAAFSRISEFSKLLQTDDVVTEVLTRLQSISGEPEYIRAALATQVSSLCVIVGRQHTNQVLLKVIFELLRDESPDVRMCLFTDLGSVQSVIGAESLAQTLMPAVGELTEHKNWRVRQQIIERMPELARQLGPDFCTDNIIPVMSKALVDPVWSVRAALIGSVKQFAEILGEEWVGSYILPEVAALKTHENYLFRVTALALAKDLEMVVSSEFCRLHLFPLISEMSADPVPNVRLNVSKAIQSLARHLDFEIVRIK
jgi:serine/threonine-protein phosphatase 2A regulatory subunit A